MKTIDLFKEIFETQKEYKESITEKHILKLRELDEYLPPMQSFFIVTNTSKQVYEFVSKNFEFALGLDREKMGTIGVPYWFSHFHSDDLPVWLKALEELMLFTMVEVKKEDRHKLSYTWNYRIRNAQGEYLNTVEHQSPTYIDEQGKPIIGLGHLSIVGRGEARPIIAVAKILNDNNEYETIYYKNHSQKLLAQALSNRENDVIRLLALNNTSKQIGEKLFISSHTVDGHRRSILKKLNFDSTQELIQYCLQYQLF